MNRLDAELDRLYLGGLVFATQDAQTLSLIDARGRVRALVLEVVLPAGWEALSRAWQGVQAELELPEPAIAVSGIDGLQLWFSLETSVDAARAHAFLAMLRERFLADVPTRRVRLYPDAAMPSRHAALVPAPQGEPGNWSAFVSADLAAVFSDTPRLDVEPGEEGQAALLRRLQPIKTAGSDAVLAATPAQARADAPERETPVHASASAPTSDADPRAFLLCVMNDERVEMALRIEAAKALLR
ncbi:MAG: hypothetical protein H7276_15745 [Caulobacter sp.]|nr:hypothetical protein [Vitreoscilla sp.]